MDSAPDLPGGAAPPSACEAPPVAVLTATVAPSTARACPVVPGQRWHAYQIGEPIEGGGPGWCFSAMNVGMLEEVSLRILPLDGEATVRRGKVWQEIKALNHPGILPLFDAREEGGFRYELSAARPPTTLREWAACRRAAAEDITMLLRSVAASLRALHQRGIVHLNIRPDTIYVTTEDMGASVVLGGLEHAIVFDQSDLVPIEVDPYYAPPEAVGLTRHSPGRALCAWDYWTLGRVLQETVLGRHVLGLWLNRDISKQLVELRPRAEALLQEKEPNAPKAGAVELMPAGDAKLASLLKGLLTTSVDGRWGPHEVQAWLNNEAVRDRYQLARSERLFVYNDRSFTVAEASEYFAKEANWEQGIRQLFALDERDTLSAFVAATPAYKPVAERLEKMRRLSELTGWDGLSTATVRSAIAAAAWLNLGADDARFTVRGKRIDAPMLKAFAKKEGSDDGADLVRALTALPYIQAIEKKDGDAGRLLNQLAATLNEAVGIAVRQRWIEADAGADYSRLMVLCLEPDAVLQATIRSLHTRFACARDPEMQRLFSAPKLTRGETVLLAFAGQVPDRFEFVSHDAWHGEKGRLLKARGEKVAVAIFWLRLQKAIWAAPLLFARWRFALPLWLCIGGSVWVYGPEPASVFWTGLALGSLLLLRVAVWWLQRLEIERCAGKAAGCGWTLFSDYRQCLGEAERQVGSDAARRPGELHAELKRINGELAQLPAPSRPPPVEAVSEASFTWISAITSWMIPLFLLGPAVGVHIVPAAEVNRGDQEVAGSSPASAEVGPDGLSVAERRFFERPDRQYVVWEHTPPETAPAAPIMGTFEASPQQVAGALVAGQKLLLPYDLQSVNSLIAVPVSEDAELALMIYDGQLRALADRRVWVLKDRPEPRSWLAVNRYKVIYLGHPPALIPTGSTDVVPEAETLRVTAFP